MTGYPIKLTKSLIGRIRHVCFAFKLAKRGERMRSATWFGVFGVLLGGCFDEGGDEAQTLNAVAVADGLIAFADIKNNLTTDPAAAGEALLKFIQTPIAAENLISPPSEQTELNIALLAAPADVPACLDSMGSEGCDRFDTKPGMTCNAGPFTFTGWASRTCDVCTDVTGSCLYDWRLDVRYVVPGVDLRVVTDGPTTTTLASISFENYFDYELNAGGIRRGRVNITSCGPANLNMGTPRRLVNSKFVVRSVPNPARCVVVSFDGSGSVSTANPTLGRCSTAASGCP